MKAGPHEAASNGRLHFQGTPIRIGPITHGKRRIRGHDAHGPCVVSLDWVLTAVASCRRSCIETTIRLLRVCSFSLWILVTLQNGFSYLSIISRSSDPVLRSFRKFVLFNHVQLIVLRSI